MLFLTAFNQEKKGIVRGRIFEKPTKTVKEGYIKVKDLIDQFMSAGMRLNAYRDGIYDIPAGSEVEDGPADPTRVQGYDLADATQDALRVGERLRKQAREIDEGNQRKADKPVSGDQNPAVEEKKDLTDVK